MTALTTPQFASLQRAITRRSRGQVSLPEVELSRNGAIDLWQHVVAAFGQDEGRALKAREFEQLRRRAWGLSKGLLALSETDLSLQRGLALWQLACHLERLAGRRRSIGLARVAGVAAMGLAATQLAACTSLFGGNIKGSFACSAPGGTCAPSTVIDDQALSVIQNARPMTPAGQHMRLPAPARPTTAGYVQPGTGRMAPARDGMVHRERRVLKVVFPSFVDGGGNLHEPRVVHTVVDDGAWMQFSAGEPTAVDQIEGRSASLANTVFTPPSSPASATLSSDAPAAPDAKMAPAGPPNSEAVAAARAKGAALRSGNAIDAIRAEVQSRLAQTARAPEATPTVNAPAPSAAQDTTPADAAKPAGTVTAPVNAPASFPAKVEE